MRKGPFHPTPRLVHVLFDQPSALGTDFPAPKRDTTYDPDWAYALSVVAGWAYADGQVFADQLQYYGFAGCTVDEISVSNPALLIVATAFFIQSADKRVGVLAFRGTEPTSLINWLTDADTAKYAFAGGYVHSGFFSNVESIWGDIVDVIQPRFDAGLEELYITGHSLGGAMSVVAAARIFAEEGATSPMVRWRSALRGIYTFGQPIVGDGAFRSTFASQFGSFLYRHIYDDDVVPCLPPTSVDSTFVHFGEKRIAAAVSDAWQLNTEPDRRATLTSLVSIFESFLTRRIDAFQNVNVSYSLDDHSPRGYIDVSRNSIAPSRAAALKSMPPPVLGRLWRRATNLIPQP
jgi:hypothetical protein